MRNSSFRSAMRSRQKLFRVLLLYLLGALVVIFYQLNKHFGVTLNDIIEWIVILCLLCCLGVVIWGIRTRRANKARAKLEDFANAPWLYERGSIELVGRVERIFTMRLSRRLRIYFNSIKRVILASGDFTGTAVHQRFLISSPNLRRGEEVMVVHNTKFGAAPIKKGSWVQVKGQYIHRRVPKGRLGRRRLSFYGLIHYTHEPKGFVRILSFKPQVGFEIKAERYLVRDGAESVEEIASDDRKK